ncbi:hypothetical protein O0L34_g16228 [Tuta absoluta]|nr:hypothetical protein O0L34_g16228 [Tuta absoluta]
MAADQAGMYAVIRGLKKSGVAVTLYGNEVVLAPDTNISTRGPGCSQLKSASTDTNLLPCKPSINTSTQAVDGRYATVYQSTIGQMRPTNPPADLTEFPPQRTDACRGGGNFVVGGPGSGDTKYRHVCCPNVYRGGGMMWPDKESVCSPRPSDIQSDAFVKSLRKYPPRLSPDRSSEIVERLINYTQSKNNGMSRSPQQGNHNHYENPEMYASKCPTKVSRGCNHFNVYDQSPTRERRCGDLDPETKNFYFKNSEARNIREVTKAIRENMPNNVTCGSSQANNQPMRSPRQTLSPNTRRSAPPPEPAYASMVHSEIQVGVPLVCRESEAVPTAVASKQDITFTCSNVEQAVQMQVAAPKNQAQSILSDLQIPSSKIVLDARKSQSTEEIGMVNSVAVSTERDQPDVVLNYSRQQNTDKPVMLAIQNSIGRIDPGPSTAIPGAASSLASPASVSIAEMNKEFLEFVKQWVNSIPIPPETPQIQEIRQGFYQGIIQAISKIKSSPGIGINPTFYEDALEDELDTLFSLLPQTDELLAKKPQLKAQLIIKNCAVNEKIKQSLAPDTFGQQVVKEISLYVPKTQTSEKDDDKIKLYEEIQMLLLAEEYIMLLRYREVDEMKANVYKNKLLRRIQEFVHELKQIHNAELRDIDDKLYMSTIAQAMQKVPLPSEETIKQEADEVMLGMEIDKWFSDLPLVKNDELIEQIRRKRLRDKLVKKVYDMEKNNSIANETGEMALRHEVSLLLDKLPLERDASLKINFMVDELTNRIKNRQGGSTANERKKVVFGQFNGQVPENVLLQHNSAQVPQQTSPPLSGRYVNAPGIPIATDIAQTMRDSSGKLWISLESSKFIWPEGPIIKDPRNQTQQSLSLAGAAQISSGPSPGLNSALLNYPDQPVSQPILKPGISMQQPALSNPPITNFFEPNFSEPREVLPNVNPQMPMQPIAPANINQSIKDDLNASLWLSKLIEDYETRHPPLPPVDNSIQFGKPRHGAIHGLSKLETSQQPLSSSLNKSLAQQPIQDKNLNESWLNKGLRDYEAKYPPLPPIDTSIQFGKPRPGVINDISKLESSQQKPPSSSLNQSKVSQNVSQSATQRSSKSGSVSLPIRGSPSRGSPRKSALEEKYKDSGWPYSLSHPVEKPQQMFTKQDNSQIPGGNGKRNISIAKQNVTRPHQSLNDAVHQSGATNPTLNQSLNGVMYPSGAANPILNNIFGQATQIPEQQATGSMWISKYINNYDALHPAADYHQTSGIQPNNISLIQAPRNKSIMQTPEYSLFDQGRPASSSFHQMEQTLVGPALDGPVSGRFSKSSPSVEGRPNVFPSAAPGSHLGQSDHVQTPAFLQTPMIQQPIVTSAGLQVPGLTPIEQQPASAMPSTIPQHSRMGHDNVFIPITMPEMRPFPGRPPVIMDDSQNTHIPEGLPKFRKFPGPPQQQFDDSTDEDSDVPCKCLGKIKKNRKKGLCRKCNFDMGRNLNCFPYPMRFYPPYPWYY